MPAVDAATGTLREVSPTRTPGDTVRMRTLATALPLGLGASPGLPPGRLFHGIAAGDCSDVYLASDRDATVYRVVLPAGPPQDR